MKHLYKISNGELISSATVIDNIPAGMAVKESDKKGVWNTETLDFDPVPLNRVISKDDYLDRFLDDEMILILTESRTDDNVKNILDILNLRDRVRLDHKTTTDALAYFEAKSLIATGRAEVILNG